MDKNIYVRPSPYASDRHENQGLEPRYLSFNELNELGHPQDTMGAIRAKCLDCCCGSKGEVRKCTVYRCSLWPMRMGSNPFHAKSKHSQNKNEAPAVFTQTGTSEISTSKEITDES